METSKEAGTLWGEDNMSLGEDLQCTGTVIVVGSGVTGRGSTCSGRAGGGGVAGSPSTLLV